jgi:hypothetical protein
MLLSALSINALSFTALGTGLALGLLAIASGAAAAQAVVCRAAGN